MSSPTGRFLPTLSSLAGHVIIKNHGMFRAAIAAWTPPASPVSSTGINVSAPLRNPWRALPPQTAVVPFPAPAVATPPAAAKRTVRYITVNKSRGKALSLREPPPPPPPKFRRPVFYGPRVPIWVHWLNSATFAEKVERAVVRPLKGMRLKRQFESLFSKYAAIICGPRPSQIHPQTRGVAFASAVWHLARRWSKQLRSSAKMAPPTVIPTNIFTVLDCEELPEPLVEEGSDALTEVIPPIKVAKAEPTLEQTLMSLPAWVQPLAEEERVRDRPISHSEFWTRVHNMWSRVKTRAVSIYRTTFAYTPVRRPTYPNPIYVPPTVEEAHFLEMQNIYSQSDTHNAPEDVSINCHQASNVIVAEQREESVAAPPPIKIERKYDRVTKKSSATLFAEKLAARDQIAEYPLLVDRWLPLGTYDWKNEAEGTRLQKFHLPAAFINKKKDQPNMIPFKIYQYFSGDMEIKVQVNSNKFMMGQLMCGWLYDTVADKKIDLRENIYTMSQTDFCLINAGTSSPGILKIPFKNPKPFLPLTTRPDSKYCANLGSLYVFVNSQLQTPSAARASCNYTVFVRFTRARFAGMRHSSVGEPLYPQMDTIGTILAVKAAEQVLSVVDAPNADLPPSQGARVPMVPQSTQSLSVGDSMPYPINPLRLSASGQTPHFDTIDEMSVKHVASKYGRLLSHTWPMSLRSGKLLFSLDASPHPARHDMQTWKIDSNVIYALPPVAVISSLYEQWSGSLKLRLDFVASQFHTGKIMVAYIPRYLGDVTYEQAQGSYCLYYSLQESQSVTFTVPYMVPYVTYPRKWGYQSTTDITPPPGRIHVFVVNELTSIENVQDSVQIIPYWAGGDDFSVYIPAQPSIGTSFWTSKDAPEKQVIARENYYPYYIGYDADLEGGRKAILRYGPIDTHLAQFLNTHVNAYYTINKEFIKYTPTMYKPDGSTVKPKYFVAVSMDDGYGAVYMSPVVDEATAIEYAKAPNRDLIMDVKQDDAAPYTPNGVNIVFDETIVQPNIDGSYTLVRSADLDDFEVIPATSGKVLKPQNGEKDLDTDVCAPAKGGPSDDGRRLFGENFQNLKTLCRRYQPYCTSVVKSDVIIGNIAFSFPVVPQGLDLNIVADESNKSFYSKCIRDGVIPLILSGYRFYRGGLRFKAIAPPTKKEQISLQHLPAYISELKVTYPRSSKVGSAYISTGYAMFTQSTTVNNILEIEVPFYKHSMFNYLQRPDMKDPEIAKFSTLGQVNVSVDSLGTGDDKTSQNVLILYALADDAVFSTFQGFPPMIILDELYQNSIYPTAEPHQLAYFQGPPEPQGLFSIDHKHTLDPKLEQELQNWTENLKSFGCNIAVDFVASIGHVLINPNPVTVAWTIAMLFVKIGICSSAYVSPITESLTKILMRLELHGAFKPTNTAPAVTAQSLDVPDDTWASFASVIWLAISAVVGVKMSQPACLVAWARCITTSITQSTRGAHFVFLFIKNNIKFLKQVYDYILMRLNKSKLFELLAMDDRPALSLWIQECEELLDVKYETETFARDSQWADRVEYAYIVGGQVMALMAQYDGDARGLRKDLFPILRDVYARLRTKRDNMHRRGNASVSRREPYCIYIFGEPGVGKSQLVSHLAMDLVSSVGIDVKGELIFNLQSGSQYWDGCRAQPVIFLDDFLCVNKSPLQEESLAALFKLKSPAIMNPPMAALEDKELRYAPELMFMTANEAFHKVSQANERAIYRRRDLLLEIELIDRLQKAGFKSISGCEEEFKVKCADFKINLRKFEHLRFRIAHNPSLEKTTFSEWLNYDEFYALAQQKFSAYRANQNALFEERRARMDALISATVSQLGRLSEKQTEYRRLAKLLVNTKPKPNVSFEMYIKAVTTLTRGTGFNMDQMNLLIQVQGGDQTLQTLLDDPIPQTDAEEGPGEPIPAGTPLQVALEDPAPPSAPAESSTPPKNDQQPGPSGEKSQTKLVEVAKKAAQIAQKKFSNFPEFKEWWGSDKFLKKEYADQIMDSCVHKYIATTAVNYNASSDGSPDGSITGVFKQWICSVREGCTNYQIQNGAAYFLDNAICPILVEDESKIQCLAQHPRFYEELALIYKAANSEMWGCFANDKLLPQAIYDCSINPELNIFKKALKILREYSVSFFEKFTSFFSKYVIGPLKGFYEFIKNLNPLLTILAVVGGLSAVALGYMATAAPVAAAIVAVPVAGSLTCSASSVQLDAKLQAQMMSSGDAKAARVRSNPHPRPPLRTFAHLMHQSGPAQPNHIDAISTKIFNNSYKVIFLTNPQNFTNAAADSYNGVGGRILFLGDKWFVATKHMFESAEKKNWTHIMFTHCATNAIFIHDKDSVRRCDQEDSSLSVCYVMGIRSHKSIVKHIASPEDHTKPRGNCVILEPEINVLNKVELPIGISKDGTILEDKTKGIARQDYEMLYTYRWSRAGRCGSILLNPALQRPIIGIHVAGNEYEGMAEPITSESFVISKDLEDEPFFIKDNEATPPVTGHYVPIGEVEESLVFHQIGETDLRATLIHGVFPVCTQPGPLQKGDPRVIWDKETPYSPLWAGVEHMCKPPQSFPTRIVARAKDDFKREILTKVKPILTNPAVLSMEHAVLGIPGFKFYDGINMQTSEGFPYTHYRPAGHSSKRWLFDIRHDRLYGLHADLREIMTYKHKLRKDGVIPLTVFTDCLKDARLPIQKVRTPGKTRIFSSSPIDFTLEFRRHFLHFLAAYKSAQFSVEHAIGINPDSADWRALVMHLRNGIEDPVYVTGDYSNFGPTLVPNIVEAVCEIIVEWNQEKLKIDDATASYQAILLQENCAAVHLAHKYLYSVLAGSPSGSPATVEINSMSGSMYLRCAWLEIAEQHDLDTTFETFKREVRFLVYGDDLIMCVSKLISQFYNNETLSKFFAHYGIKFTDASKSGNIAYVDDLGQTTFLKRGFKRHPHFQDEFLAPLDLDASVKDTANWCHKCPDMVLATRQAAEDCLANAYGHGPETYSEIRQELSRALARKGIDWTPRTWDDWDQLHFPEYHFDVKNSPINKLQREELQKYVDRKILSKAAASSFKRDGDQSGLVSPLTQLTQGDNETASEEIHSGPGLVAGTEPESTPEELDLIQF